MRQLEMQFAVHKTAFSPRAVRPGIVAKLRAVQLIDSEDNEVGGPVTNEVAIKRLVRRHSKKKGPLTAWVTGVTFIRDTGKKQKSDMDLWSEIKIVDGVLNADDIDRIIRTLNFPFPAQRR